MSQIQVDPALGNCDHCGKPNYSCLKCGLITCRTPCSYCSSLTRQELKQLTRVIREGLEVLRQRGVTITEAQIDERANNIAQAVMGWVEEREGA